MTLKHPLIQQLNHHSTPDWDFTNAAWFLDSFYFVSPPYSLNLWYLAPTGMNVCLCNHPSTLHIPEGRFVSSFLARSPFSHAYLIFRNTEAPGSAWKHNCYAVRLDPPDSKWYLERWIDDSYVRLGTSDKSSWDPYTWIRARATWLIHNSSLRVTLGFFIDGEWVEQGLPIDDPDPHFGDEPYQRCGLQGYNGGLGLRNFFDDTEIWQKS